MEALAAGAAFRVPKFHAWIPALAFRAAMLKRVVAAGVAIGAAKHARDGLRD